MQGPGRLTVFFGRFVFLWVLGALGFVFHGLAFHLTPWSQTIVNGIVKYGYPSTGQEDTTVVLFREENLQTLAAAAGTPVAYPVPYATHAEVLEALAAYQPRAVFVDFAFMDPRPPADVQRLGEAICVLAKTEAKTGAEPKMTTRVYLADPPDPITSPAAAPRKDCDACAPTNTNASAGVLRPVRALLTCGAKPVNPSVKPDSGVSGVLEYELRVDGLDSPAFAMRSEDLDQIPADPMEILWGYRPHALNAKWMNQAGTERNCPDTIVEPITRVVTHMARDLRDLRNSVREDLSGLKKARLFDEPWSVLTAFGQTVRTIRGSLTDPRLKDIVQDSRSELRDHVRANLSTLAHALYHDPLSAARVRCPYTRTISVRHLLQSIDDHDVTEAIEGKTIFYGAGFYLAGDILASPVHVEFPSVYLHAMAYDNLVTLRENYKRADPTRAWFLDASVLACLVLLALWPELPDPWRRTLLGVFALIVLVVTFVTIAHAYTGTASRRLGLFYPVLWGNVLFLGLATAGSAFSVGRKYLGWSWFEHGRSRLVHALARGLRALGILVAILLAALLGSILVGGPPGAPPWMSTALRLPLVGILLVLVGILLLLVGIRLRQSIPAFARRRLGGATVLSLSLLAVTGIAFFPHGALEPLIAILVSLAAMLLVLRELAWPPRHQSRLERMLSHCLEALGLFGLAMAVFLLTEIPLQARMASATRFVFNALLFTLAIWILTIPRPRHGFLSRWRLTFLLFGFAVFAFLVTDGLFGLETAALVGLAFLFVYKLVIAEDQLFLVLAAGLIIVSLFSFFPGNLGPRNIVGFLLFFEVARHLVERADEAAREYSNAGVTSTFWNYLFKLCRRESRGWDTRESFRVR